MLRVKFGARGCVGDEEIFRCGVYGRKHPHGADGRDHPYEVDGVGELVRVGRMRWGDIIRMGWMEEIVRVEWME